MQVSRTVQPSRIAPAATPGGQTVEPPPAAAFPGIVLLDVKRNADERGFFAETYNKTRMDEAGIDADFVQDNHSYSAKRGTVRGLHYQCCPHAQAKLVQVVRGAIFDVVVDLRRDSPTFRRHVSAIISAERGNQIFVPPGFAHGFCTLEPDTDVLYKVDDYYTPECDRGILWNDPDLAIAWPIGEDDATLSDRDRRHPRLADAQDLF